MHDAPRAAPGTLSEDSNSQDTASVPEHVDQQRRERLWVVIAAAVLTVLRSATLVFFEGARFDSDQALLGLMAKHLMEGRAFPVFTYGQPYMLGVEAWMAVPFFLVGGMTVAMLKLPLLLVNVAASVLLVRLIERASGLRPLLALVPALFFILIAPGTATLLLEASGGNVEPFLIVLLLWTLRGRSFLFGAVLAFGVLQREFAVYGLGALVIMRLADRSLFRTSTWRPAIAGAVSFGAMWQGVYLLKQFSSIRGPGTFAQWAPLEASANLSAMASRICIAPAEFVPGFTTLVTERAADLLGASYRDMAAFTINSTFNQGAPWLWPVLGPALVVLAVRAGWQAWQQRGQRAWPPRLEFALYLFLIGAQALLVYAFFRCGRVSISEIRYALLGVFGAVGIVTAILAVDPSRLWRRAAVAVVLLWAGVTALSHARLAREYLTNPPPDARRELADTLLDQGVRFAYADFWEAYIVSFYTNEEVIVASTSFVFIDEYQWLVDRRADEAVHIRREPCEGGTPVGDWLFICR